MISAEALYKVLIAQTEDNLDKTLLQFMYNELPKDASLNDFREELVDSGLMTYSSVMQICFSQLLVPRSKLLLNRLAEHRKNNISFVPQTHEHKFQIGEDDQLSTSVVLGDGELNIKIPRSDLSILPFIHSDEKQAVMLADDMANLNELKECELILLETADSFPSSIASGISLCWLYLSTGKYKEVETWAYRLLEHHEGNVICLRMLAIAEQASNKHLMAMSNYQHLLISKHVSPLWYLLLGYSQQKTGCNAEAIESYRTFLQLGKFEDYYPFARQQLKELTA
ncbi:hypothetical protein [Reinekea marinisedimentorum]|uniref:Tetratricopeptide repeat protein n=1 Tax=Reinekea marinisedimentorum TaxID=230495 RepID=A0A4R3IC99_9GAMM|nr:hypothetical protein [Reinekea marinisedimentorum]TCS43186.1 hypothetical protein BCF53_102212 [Reinekea marinisedimentorum]